jgi:putative tryptophan/tyrosine transport system substrate-binding protein
MKRAAVLSILVVVMLLAVAVIAEAQQPGKIRRIGFLAVNTPSADKHLDEAFKQSLRELGWIEGRNITIEYKSAEGNADRLRALAAELVDSKVDVIVSAGGTPGAQGPRRLPVRSPLSSPRVAIQWPPVSSPASLGLVVTLRDSAALVPI